MSDDVTPSSPPTPPPPIAPDPSKTRARASNGAVGWVIAAVVVLVLAVAGGLFTAWVVANMKAVPGPVAGASATPAHVDASAQPTVSPGASVEPTDAPRRTPTPPPTAEVTLPPFTYVVQPGDHLVNIAGMFQVAVQDIIDLNGIKNPNRLQVGQELLIPGYGVQPTPKPSKKPR
ncbi:MAG TPA: LysM domain-containing protein [Candidatus Limnocylindrales bacterium]